MKSLLVGSALAGLLVAACLPARAAQVYSNDFSADQNGFVGGSRETSPSGETYLANFQRSTTTLTISGLAANSAVSLDFTLDVINSLDGDGQTGGGPDFFNVSFNGGNVFHYTFSNYGNGDTQSYPIPGSAPGTGAAGTDTLGWTSCCGNQLYSDSIYNIALNGFSDALGALVIVFNDASNEDYNNEHYGVDNVVVDGALANATPLPAALPMFAGGLGIVGFLTRRRRRLAA